MRLLFLMTMFLFFLIIPLDSHFKFFLEARKPPEIKTIEVIATAYYKPVRGQKRYRWGSYEADVRMNGNGINYLGKKSKIGDIATDPEVISLWSQLFVPGYGWGVARDIGSVIKGEKIDLFMGEGEKGLKRAIEWGERKVAIQVEKMGRF